MKIYLNVMKNKCVILIYAMILFFIGCNGQSLNDNVSCNRTTVDKSIAKKLPNSICIPNGYTIDLIIDDVDFNKDLYNDVIIRYSKYPLVDGNMRIYSIYKNINDTLFKMEKELNSLAIPYIDNLSTVYLESNSLADSLVNLFPIDTKISFSLDTIFVSHLIPDYYGKTYVFIYNLVEADWLLKEIQYWIGELPTWLVKNSNLDESLRDKINLETRIPENVMTIEKFNLIESKVLAIDESDYFMNNYDIYDWGK